MGKSTISMAIFNSYFDITTRGYIPMDTSISKLNPLSPSPGRDVHLLRALLLRVNHLSYTARSVAMAKRWIQPLKINKFGFMGIYSVLFCINFSCILTNIAPPASEVAHELWKWSGPPKHWKVSFWSGKGSGFQGAGFQSIPKECGEQGAVINLFLGKHLDYITLKCVLAAKSEGLFLPFNPSQKLKAKVYWDHPTSYSKYIKHDGKYQPNHTKPIGLSSFDFWFHPVSILSWRSWNEHQTWRGWGLSHFFLATPMLT